MKNINTNNKRIVFKLKHWEGITLFKVIEQECIERGCGEIFKGSNWRIYSQGKVLIDTNFDHIYLTVLNKESNNEVSVKEDKDKSIYNSILETFKELGSQSNDEPKYGDRVLVREHKEGDWSERVLVHILPKEALIGFVCVHNAYEEEFSKGASYHTINWSYMKPLEENTFKEISEDTFEVTF